MNGGEERELKGKGACDRRQNLEWEGNRKGERMEGPRMWRETWNLKKA